jgi:Vitamin K-dependent gamma-carboxylase
VRQAVAAIGHYLASLALGLARGWNDFWYTPVDPSLLGLMRIMTGLVLLYDHAIWGVVLQDFFGTDAWINRDLVDFSLKDAYAFTFFWSVSPRWLWLAYALSMTVLFWFTIGLWTRVSSILSVVVVISFVYRVPEALFGLDKIINMLTLYLAIGPSGKALSVDSWLARRRAKDRVQRAPSIAANFALRLIQIHMCIVYFFAGASKLQGAVWWNGQAMWMVFANLEYQSIDMTWLAWHPRLVELLSHITVFWELSFCVLIWVPALRPLVLFASLALHLGIGATMGLWTFSLAMLIGCAAFLPAEGVARLSAALRMSREPKATTTKRPGVR